MNLGDGLLNKARRRTGLNQIGDSEFLPRLEAWLRALERDRGLNEAGRDQALASALQHACNRLKLEAIIARHPEITAIALPRPFVVSGLPRSGTTALARLLAPRRRWLPYWEAIDPFGTQAPAQRRQMARRRRDAALAAAPGMSALHDWREDAFTDDTELQALAFGSYGLEWHAHVPDWRDAYLLEDQIPVYRYLKRAMQALTFLRGPNRWVIKSPQHIEQLQALHAVFPDAQLVLTWRPVEQALRSIGKVMDALAPLRGRPMPIGYWRGRFAGMLARFEATKDLFPKRIEVQLSEWGLNPAEAAASIEALMGANLQGGQPPCENAWHGGRPADHHR